MKRTLSVVISAYNESATLSRCIKSVRFADEVVVVDNESQDDTAALAKKLGAKVVSQPNRLMLNINKNYGFSKATGDWILNLDADEEVTPELASEIKKILENDGDDPSLPGGYWIARKNIIYGKWIRHGLWWPDKQLRLFRRGKGVFACRNIHEYVKVDGSTADASSPMNHYNYRSISQYLAKIERCTTSEAIVLKESGYPLTWKDALRFPVSDFVKIYFAEGGYRDGLHGLVLALFQAFYAFVTFAKAWEDRGFPEEDICLPAVSGEIGKASSDIRYWIGSVRIAGSRSPIAKLFEKIRRRLSMIVAWILV